MMWKFISLSFIEYKALTKFIDEFLSDEHKLRQLQQTGHLPLILSERREQVYNVTLAPQTLDVLCSIDSRFMEYKRGVKTNTFDASIIDSHQLVLGHKESFKMHVLKNPSHKIESLN